MQVALPNIKAPVERTTATDESEPQPSRTPPYEIPKGGPTGVVLNILGRHFFRPAHLHVKVRHPQYGDLTSQLFFDGGDYLNSDVANAARDSLVAQLVRRDDPTDLAARRLRKPYFEVR
jgi:catechol 1,2-dioxygenase